MGADALQAALTTTPRVSEIFQNPGVLLDLEKHGISGPRNTEPEKEEKVEVGRVAREKSQRKQLTCVLG